MTARSETPSDRADDGSQAREEGADRPEESARPLSKDTIFELLKNQRRRYVLRYLADDPGPARLCADRLVVLPGGDPLGALSSDERKRVYVGLYQCHLTKMDDAGVVAFNQDRGLVTLGERASELYEYLDPDRENEGSWSLAYLAFAAVSAVLALLVEAGFPASILPGAAVTGVVVVGFALLALVHAATVSVLDVGTPMAAIDAVTGALADTDRS
jgi:hypothetical protein